MSFQTSLSSLTVTRSAPGVLLVTLTQQSSSSSFPITLSKGIQLGDSVYSGAGRSLSAELGEMSALCKT